MPTLKHGAFFRRHPVFTGRELAAHLSSTHRAGPRTQEALLAYHTGAGHLVRVRRGLYATIPPGADGDSHPIDPYLVASRLTDDSVLAHHTALEFHGRAYSAWRHVTYLADRPPGPVSFRSHVFRGARFPRALARSGNQRFGVLAAERAGMTLSVASLERTLVDALDRPQLSGGWEEVWRSLESVEFFDLDEVVEYALLLENATTASKVGFFLEQRREALMVGDGHLRALADRRPRRPHYLDRSRRETGRLLPRWNLVVPAEVVERSWAAVT